MNTTARARTLGRPPRAITLIIAAAFSGTGLLLAGCAGGAGTPASSAPRAGAGSAHEAVGAVPAARAPAAVHQAGLPAASRATRLAVSSQSIIYTASLTVQAKDVTAAAKRAVAIVTAAGGYTSNEHESLRPGKHALAVVSLQLKFPVAQYPAALGQLSKLGTQTSLTQQAQDVTQQVADVSSRVTSAQAAITQLRALLRRAGSVSSLLSVQDQINAEESSLEALLAQRRALAHETTFATVSLRLVNHPKAAPGKKKQKREHGFVAGLSAGWHALRLIVSGLLTGLGAALPFALIAALAGGIVYGSRRRLVRRKSRPTAAQ
jgi:Domain of unknown function (DUF4349)